jgi:hypothetical protein
MTGAWVMMALLTAGCASTGETSQEPTTAADTTQQLPAPPPSIPATVPVTVPDPVAAEVVDSNAVPGRFDLGKMWTFEYPPVEYFQEAYGLNLDESWFERARLGALRMPGCTASFVSPNGLVMTNHHCARDWITVVTRSGETLLDDGFYAPSTAEERPVEGLYMEQLIAITDVTDEVRAAEAAGQTNAERAQARNEAIGAVTDSLVQEAGGEGVTVEVVSLWQGGRYSAYTFRRYEDVRLVMAPELQIAYFGGDPDNFTYPRYDLDMSFFRVYQDGQPMQTPNHFPFSDTGAEVGDVVFVIGNPGSTFRLETAAMLEFRRDVQDLGTLEYIDRGVEAFSAALEDESSEVLENDLFSLLNSQKAYRGRVEALNDSILIARRLAEEEEFVRRIRANPTLAAEYGNLVDELASIQAQRQELTPDFRAFLALAPGSIFSSATLRRALVAYIYQERQRAGASPEALASLRQQLFSIPDQPEALDWRLLAGRFRTFQQHFGETASVTQQILQGRTPDEQAQYVVNNSVMADAARLAQALEQGNLPANDPALQVVAAFYPRYQTFQSAYNGLVAQQQEALARLGRARYEIFGTDIPPDATFSLRLADGVVRGYANNGTFEPHQTTFFGLYDRHYSHSHTPNRDEWDLPERWQNPPASFDLFTPLNFVSTNDIIGGNSGSPVLNSDLEVVGLVFDGNIQSLSGAYIYLEDPQRAVSVDARGITAALDHIYDADRLALELRSGRLVETEAQADAVSVNQ